MALANYTDLQASVALWLNRSDLTSVTPDFIALCEADLNRRLRTPFNEKKDSLVVSSRFTDLPSDFAEMRTVFITVGGTRFQVDPYTGTGALQDGETHYLYAINNNQLEMTTTGTLEIRYWKKVPALSTNTTNDILTNFPDVYLFGSCLHAGYFMDDAQMIAKWETKYERALEKANATRFRQFGSGLQVRAG